jgi:nucleoside-diphosphate-sugar epimerase
LVQRSIAVILMISMDLKPRRQALTASGHTHDVGHCFCLALEKAPAGSRLHAVGDEGIPMREIARSIGDRTGLQTASIPPDQLETHFGFLAMLIALDNPTSNVVTRRVLGWEPTHPGLLADFDQADYFMKKEPTSRIVPDALQAALLLDGSRTNHRLIERLKASP